MDGRQKNSLDPRKLFDTLSAVCQREEEVAKRLEPTPAAQEKPESTEHLPEHHTQPDFDQPPSPLIVPDLNSHTVKRKKSKHKHRDQVSTTGRVLYAFSELFKMLLSCLSSVTGMYLFVCLFLSRKKTHGEAGKKAQVSAVSC